MPLKKIINCPHCGAKIEFDATDKIQESAHYWTLCDNCKNVCYVRFSFINIRIEEVLADDPDRF